MKQLQERSDPHLNLADYFPIVVADMLNQWELKTYSNAVTTPVYERLLRNMTTTFAFFCLAYLAIRDREHLYKAVTGLTDMHQTSNITESNCFVQDPQNSTYS